MILIRETALAAEVYPSPTLRATKAIYLLVKRPDLGGVDELLRSMSYTSSSPAARRQIAYVGPDGFPGLRYTITFLRQTPMRISRSRSRTSGTGPGLPTAQTWAHFSSATRTCCCTSLFSFRLDSSDS